MTAFQTKIEWSATDAVAAAIEAADLSGADIVLVQPPFASPDRPSLGLHILQGIARTHSLTAPVLYANLSFARMIGPGLYRSLCHTPTEDLIGERLFRLAWPAAGAFGPGPVPERWDKLPDGTPSFRHLQEEAVKWAEAMAEAIATLSVPIVGFSSSFEQTVPSLAMAARLKAHAPGTTTILGGANADDVMGEGLADLAGEIDHVFQGEAEASFAAFLDARAAGAPVARVLPGMVNEDLEDMPPPDYADFFEQWTALVAESAIPGGLRRSDLRLPYESSRGCWWGEKHHCTFCGLNANGMNHRIKSPEKVQREILALAEVHDVSRVLMVDNIMPHGYVSTLLPRLASAERRLEIFYEQKANLDRRRMSLLRDAGVTTIQPGIESLSTALLTRMRKGTSLRVNLDCLRYARAAGISLAWNLLSDFPGDDEQDYEAMILLFPLLHHLEPPGGLGGLSIDRFSPYHMTPEAFGISEVEPLPAYGHVFPMGTDTRLAYHFQAQYPSALRRNRRLGERLAAAVADWRKAWMEGPPILYVFDLDDGRHLVVDTRGRAGPCEPRMLNSAEANLILVGASTDAPGSGPFLDREQVIRADGRVLAISCAAPDSRAWTWTPSPVERAAEEA